MSDDARGEGVELNARGRRVVKRLHDIPEPWVEAALGWLERNQPYVDDDDDRLIVLLTNNRMKQLLCELDNHADRHKTPPGILRAAYRGIIDTMMRPPEIPAAMQTGPAPSQGGWTDGALRRHRARMAGIVRRVAHALVVDPAADASLAELLALSDYAPPVECYAQHEPAAAQDSAVMILRDLARALDRGDSINGRDHSVFALGGHMETGAKDAKQRKKQEETARQRLFEQNMHTYLSMAANDRARPFDHFTAAALYLVLDIATNADKVGRRRRARRKPQS